MSPAEFTGLGIKKSRLELECVATYLHNVNYKL